MPVARARVLVAIAAGLLATAFSARSALALNAHTLYHQAAADMAAASTFVERSLVTERTARLVIHRTVIAEYDQGHGRTRIHAYELRQQPNSRGVWQTRTRYLDIIFLGTRSYVRTTPGLHWRLFRGSHYTDAGWRDTYTSAAPSFDVLPPNSLRLAGSPHGEIALQAQTRNLTGKLWITEGPKPYLVRYQARYDRVIDGMRSRVQEDSRFYSFNHPLKIVAPSR